MRGPWLLANEERVFNSVAQTPFKKGYECKFIFMVRKKDGNVSE